MGGCKKPLRKESTHTTYPPPMARSGKEGKDKVELWSTPKTVEVVGKQAVEHIVEQTGKQVVKDTDFTSTPDGFMDENLETSPIFQLEDNNKEDQDNITSDDSSPEFNREKRKAKKEATERDGHKPVKSKVAKTENVCIENNAIKEFSNMMERVTEMSVGLLKLISENVNTKVEIKNAVRELNWRVNTYQRDLREMEKEIKEKKEKSYSRQEEDRKRKIAMKSIAIQTDEKEITKEIDLEEKRHMKELITIISTTEDVENLKKVINKPWPPEAYRVTEMEVAEISEIKLEGELAVFMNNKNKQEEAYLKDLKLRLPGFAMLVEEDLEEGKLEYVKTHTEIINSRRGKINPTTGHTIYALPMVTDGSGYDDLEKMYSLCKQLKEELDQETKEIKIIIGSHFNRETVRKCAEYTFKRSNKKIILNQVGVTAETGKRHLGGRRRNIPDVGKIIVKVPTGKSYLEVLKNVKTSIDIEKSGTNVRRIRKTAKGDLYIEVAGGEKRQEKSETLFEQPH